MVNIYWYFLVFYHFFDCFEGGIGIWYSKSGKANFLHFDCFGPLVYALSLAPGWPLASREIEVQRLSKFRRSGLLAIEHDTRSNANL